jgi:hypothetical protein
MSAAVLAGVSDVWGTDILRSAPANDFLPKCNFEIHDASEPFDLHRKFDCVICLEVGEHLREKSAKALIGSLCRHGNLVFFSAAQPGQFGQDHVNCQWPSYWQGFFNGEGFTCVDDVRWQMWSDTDIEPWYRQNMFRAVRDSKVAGSELRIPPVVHPEMLGLKLACDTGSKAGQKPFRSRVFRSVKAMIQKVAGGRR